MSHAITGGLVDGAPLEQLLASVGVTKLSVIRITGPSALGALLWFCRHDFDEVGYVRPGDGAPHEPPDAIIVAHTCNELELKRLLAVGRQVKPGGVFLFRCRVPGQSTLMALDWLLDRAGFVIDRQIVRHGRALVVARRRAAQMLKAA
jgi:hypothetical protein